MIRKLHRAAFMTGILLALIGPTSPIHHQIYHPIYHPFPPLGPPAPVIICTDTPPILCTV